jgi:hypothetical protein
MTVSSVPSFEALDWRRSPAWPSHSGRATARVVVCGIPMQAVAIEVESDAWGYQVAVWPGYEEELGGLYKLCGADRRPPLATARIAELSVREWVVYIAPLSS